MRYHDLFDARAWKKYEGRDRLCRLISLSPDRTAGEEIESVPVQCGLVYTGKQRVFAGYFVQAILPSGEPVLAEDPHILRRALCGLELKLNALGWSLGAIGLDERFEESGLSSNTGWGFHAEKDGAVHMLDSALINRVPESDAG